MSTSAEDQSYLHTMPRFKMSFLLYILFDKCFCAYFLLNGLFPFTYLNMYIYKIFQQSILCLYGSIVKFISFSNRNRSLAMYIIFKANKEAFWI